MTEVLTGVLTDYALMDEGKNEGYYAIRLGDSPYPVMHHVDPFLVKLKKGCEVDVSLNKDKWVSKIMPAREKPRPVQQQPITSQQRSPETAEKMTKNGFGPDTAAPEGQNTCTSPPPAATESQKEDGVAKIVRETKERNEAITEMTAAEVVDMVPVDQPNLLPGEPMKFNADQVNLIKASIARDCTDTEFKLLLYLAGQYHLDPLRRQIWAVKYGNSPANIFTGRDGFLEIAHRSGQFDGMESGTRKEGEEIVGWAKVYRKDMTHAFVVEVFLSEFNTGKSNWAKMPRVMIQKVAESQCLRKAFSVSGLYSPEEIPPGNGGA